MIHPDGRHETKKLGVDLATDNEFHVLGGKGITFTSNLADKKSFAPSRY
jgi:hypothetical protein